jgi:PKD repeat protein
MTRHTYKARWFALLALVCLGCTGTGEESGGTSADSQAIENNAGTCESSRRPRMITDREDYTTGLPVNLTGKGLECGATYNLVITRPDGTTHEQTLTADGTGTVLGVFIFDSQLGNYNAELLNSAGTVVAHLHFHGSHFRYGHLTWRTVGPRTAEFSLVNAFRRDYAGSGPDGLVVTGDTFTESIGGTALCFGDGSCTNTLTYEAISYDIPQGWVIGRAISVGGTQTLPGTGVTVNEIEPNNTIATANRMNLGDDYASNIASPGEGDYVSFTLTQRSRINLRTVHVTIPDSYLYLYDRNGLQLAADDDSGGGGTSLINITLDPGTYYIRAAGYASNVGRMTVQLRQVSNAPTGPITHTYAGDGPYTAAISSCCRITNLSNPNEDYIIRTPVRFNVANSSPVSGLPPIVNAPVNTPNFTFQVPAVDAEGDQLTFRLAAQSESGIRNPISGLTVSSTGLVSWNTVGKAVGQLYTTQIIIEERRGGQLIGSSAVDFILRIVDTLGHPPVCVLPSQTSYTVNAGELVQFTIGTADQDANNTLTLNTGGVPAGASLTPALPRQGPPGISTTFNWTPSVSVAGSSFVVGFTVTDNTNQAAQCSVNITVRPQPVNRPPVANAGLDQSVLEGTAVTLNGGGSSDPDGHPITYSWTLMSSTGPAVTLANPGSATPSFVTTDDGVYTFLLTVRDSLNATGSDTVTVTVGNVAPTVAATGGSISEGSSFSSSGSFTDPGADTWAATVDYGDGSGVQPLALSGRTFNLNHFYADNGTFLVAIRVTDDNGGIGSITVPVNVSNIAPVVMATGGSISEGSAFTAPGSFIDPGADSWTARVDYGDGSGPQPLVLTGKSFTLNHVYTQSGTYSVTITVTDDDGGVGSITVPVVVSNVAPVVSATGGTINEGSAFGSSGSFSDPGAESWTATVDYGDGSGVQPLALNGKTFSLSHFYGDNGTFPVTITIVDSDGGVGTATVSVIVNNVAPAVSAAGGTLDEGSPFASSGSFSDPGADSWTATVDYGDGSGVQPLALAGNGFSLNHVYANSGTYSVTVTVTDDDGGVGSTTVPVVVNNVAPTVSAAGGTLDEGAVFSSSGSFSDPGADSWTGTVDYGDGSGPQPLVLNGNTFALSHFYGDNGTFPVTITIVDSDGGVGTTTVYAVVNNVAPVVSAAGGSTDEGSPFASAGAFGDPGADSWTATVDYGDGSGVQALALNGRGFNLGHVYADNGTYAVTITVTDDDGGVGSATVQVVVNNVAPTVSAAGGTIDEGTSFASAGSFADPGADSWLATVDYGDGSGVQALALNGRGFNLNHFYGDNGTYLVTITVVDDDGGIGTALVPVVVNNVSPVVSTSGGVIPEGSSFASVGGFIDPGADSWTATVDYGDGSGAQPLSLLGNTFALSHYYDDNGIFTVTVTVADDDGGVGTASVLVVVNNVAPTVTASNDSPRYWGVPVNFTGTATDPSNADTAAGFASAWTLGDGATASGLSTAHAYANPGSYQAVLTVTDKDGGSGSASTAVEIQKRPANLSCGDATAVFGFPTALSAQLADALPGAQLGGKALAFQLGANGLGTVATDASGSASVQSPGHLMPGSYTVTVSFAGDSHYTAAQASCTLTVTNSDGKITGGAVRFANKARGGFNVQVDDEGVLKGELQFQNNTLSFHAHTMTALGISADKKSGWFAGIGKDGRTFRAYVEDNGEPGSNDVLKLWIDGVLQTGTGQLSGGNIQIH